MQKKKEKKLNRETWKFLRNISIITLITSIILFTIILTSKLGTIVLMLLFFWPLIICFLTLLIISLIILIISLIKLKKWKK